LSDSANANLEKSKDWAFKDLLIDNFDYKRRIFQFSPY